MRFRTRTTTPPDPSKRGPRPTKGPMLMAAIAGGLSLLSFAPLGWWPTQLLVLAFLFYQVGIDPSPKRATLIGWAFGFGWCVAGMHWLFIALNRFGGLAAPLAALAICLLGVYMGLFAAFATGVASWLRRRWSLSVTAYLLLVLPPLWGASEWLRGWVFTGFPWASAGYAHTDGALGGYAALIGVYGIGALAALCASCLVMLTQRTRVAGIALLCVVVAAGYGLRQVTWTHAVGKPLSVRLLQGNVPQAEKFDAAHINSALALYRGMITEQPADLIAGPETAVVLFPQQLPPDYLASLSNFARATNSALLFGIPLNEAPNVYSNSVAGIAPSGAGYHYDKHHLVPFGEFVPSGFRWFIDMVSIPLGDFNRGAAVQQPFAVRDQWVLPNVCYEDVFGDEIALQLREAAHPATLLLNVSNLAWYGESVAIPQHLQISQMRARETGRPMLRATNTGATAVINPDGSIASQLPAATRGTLAASVQGMAGMTPYIRFGDRIFFTMFALALGAAWILGRRRLQKKQK
jgi:apolipoprotein N-acyltransferase